MSRKVDPLIVPRTKEALQALRGRGPIIVGPWLGEVGFELLYWIPFLRWACAFARLKPEDLWIVSRGGCRAWYADLSPHYVDAFQFYSPAEFRAGNAARMAEQAVHLQAEGLSHGRPSTKQHMVTAFDRDLLAHVTRTTGVPSTHVLHPSLLYTLFRAFWRRQLPELYTQMTRPQRIPPPARLIGVPASYVAAKFYASAACSQSPLHTQMVNDIVRAVAATTDVVLLHTGTRYDDHGEFQIDRHPRVHRVPMEAATNLETQTAIVGGASSFIGTYGGFAYLAPFLGIRSRTFYAQPNFRRDHRQVIDRVCADVLRIAFTVELLGGGAGHVAKPRRRRAA